MKRSKTPLVLMEQLVMLLVFALAAAVCLQIFVFADRSSRLIQDRDNAALLCQNTAETIQSTHGDIEGSLAQVSSVSPCQRDGFGYFVHYDGDWNAMTDDGRPLSPRYTLRARALDSGVPGLGKAEIEAYRWQNDTMESLFFLEIAWQEVSGYGA